MALAHLPFDLTPLRGVAQDIRAPPLPPLWLIDTPPIAVSVAEIWEMSFVSQNLKEAEIIKKIRGDGK